MGHKSAHLIESKGGLVKKIARKDFAIEQN